MSWWSLAKGAAGNWRYQWGIRAGGEGSEYSCTWLMRRVRHPPQSEQTKPSAGLREAAKHSVCSTLRVLRCLGLRLFAPLGFLGGSAAAFYLAL